MDDDVFGTLFGGFEDRSDKSNVKQEEKATSKNLDLDLEMPEDQPEELFSKAQQDLRKQSEAYNEALDSESIRRAFKPLEFKA
jgi:hypothetical protein